ncbi:sce7726 family protein [Alkalicoccobacillus plakortidis]|uniref:Sce7726 family protein n=1 Tax=Alkalicoccobacillus plakortidis TaxID=444060 RepID=A0ABT0XFR4_9BACI|nr:sce7726 family protein [Alkalicoccobacillus plakortidis]MCM2674069.1 sce7726 family protein [Alkalicoccobacillus plakortidis]
MKIKDANIREALHSYLNDVHEHETDTKIVDEMGVLHGQSRIDVAVINGILHGYEIKSESDTLTRLPRQIKDYNLIFDRMTIVVQKNYLNEVRNLIPKWWGIILVSKKNDSLILKQVRKGRLNKDVDPYSLTHLLWKDEALDLLKKEGLHKGYVSKPRNVLYSRICSTIEVKEIKRSINLKLKSRENWKVL